MTGKPDIRCAMLERRRHLSVDWIRQRSQAIQERAMKAVAFETVTTVCGYLSMPGEVRTEAIRSACHEKRKRLCVPVWDGEQKAYRPAWCESTMTIRLGRFGVPEPVDKQWVPDDTMLDWFLVPGLAFDPCGHRVGHGGGHYDRLLAAWAREGSMRMGLAFDFQIIETIPADAHDVSLDCLVTETRILSPAERAA